MDFVENYILGLRNTRHSGAAVDETAHYGTLQNLLNEIGKTLAPKVHCIIGLKNQGAGLPDGGLFTPDQIRKQAKTKVFDQLPARGAIEVKGTKDNVEVIADSKQVRDYLERYGLVLVTNYRDFLLLERGKDGIGIPLERFSLADSEQDFWSQADHPRAMAAKHGERFSEYLKRVMQQAAPLSEPKDLAWFLASYARDAKARVEAVKDLAALNAVRASLEEALGLKFEGEKGEHFFRSTLVQTLFYGLFSAWVLWSKEKGHSTKDRFDWRMAQWSLHVPMIRALFEQVSRPSQLGPLGLEEVMNWAGEVLNRVKREEFFVKFKEEHAVQYFYEPFLQAFDPELRKELGVWYTPPEIVKYMVERVDRVLREELEIADGLADPNVYVLDPCCGTGAYLVETLKRIEETLRQKGEDGLIGHDVKQAAMKRVFGFEILPAPFVVAHLQLGVLLQNLGAQLSDEKNERAGVYLTNALTGWEPPKEPKTQLLLWGELQQEREAANKIKQEAPILVILGNPPYNGYAGIAMDEERELSDAYRTTKLAAAPQGQGLNDLYVRFFRMAERRITDGTGKGIVCFISNYSWLDGLSFTGMRERYLEAFDKIWIDCLNGDKYKTGKLTPQGDSDPSVFSTEWNREGIQVGTAVALLARNENHSDANAVMFRQFWGVTKREQLYTSHQPEQDSTYSELKPELRLGLPYNPALVSRSYLDWPLLPELFPVSYPGVTTSRDAALVDNDVAALTMRMEQYFNPLISDNDLRHSAPCLMADTERFKAAPTRALLIKRGFIRDNIVRYSYRPFDHRWVYWDPETKLLDEKRAEFFEQVFPGNSFLFATGRTRKSVAEPAFYTSILNDYNCLDSGARGFPLYTRVVNPDLFSDTLNGEYKANVTSSAKSYLLGCACPETDLMLHTLATLNCQAYLRQNTDSIRLDWPRIPLPNTRELLTKSAELGKKIAALLDTETDVAGVTSGEIRPELRKIGGISGAAGGQIDPGAGDLRVTAGWGHGGKNGATMPGKGKIERRAFGAEESDCDLALLGSETLDVYLNDKAYWKNIPARVWDYHIGGYQVIKKWLSYREYGMLGRDLKPEEAREVTNMARRIAAIILLEPELDANYAAVKGDCYPWKAEGRE